jgi:hypothetical protein
VAKINKMFVRRAMATLRFRHMRGMKTDAKGEILQLGRLMT